MYLSGLRRRDGYAREDQFPWSLPIVRNLDLLEFNAPVTFLVGENGCGKSTLLEGMAAGMKAIAVGSRDLDRDHTLWAAQEFAKGFVFLRRRYPRTKMFLRAEDVFGYIGRIGADIFSLSQVEEQLRAGLPEGGRERGAAVAARQRQALERSYGTEPDSHSHGETFLGILNRRLVPNGLYFLDEPETPLSPTRVLALIALIKDRVEHGGQFVIATHSPMLMAVPGAEILLFEKGRIRPVPYDDVEHVRITKAFLNDPNSYLRRL
ncbi:MAG: AAA family ATPase [Proteobacteria bacterium]|nr:AAA family ATPase [Pseudomonadota bacterium]